MRPRGRCGNAIVSSGAVSVLITSILLGSGLLNPQVATAKLVAT